MNTSRKEELLQSAKEYMVEKKRFIKKVFWRQITAGKTDIAEQYNIGNIFTYVSRKG